MRSYKIQIIEESNIGDSWSAVKSAPDAMEAIAQFLLEIYGIDNPHPAFRSVSAFLIHP